MTDLNLTPEEQFILTCLRTEFSGNGDVDFSAFDFKSFDWDHVYKRSRQWRVAPLLYKAIKNRTKSPLIKGDSGGCYPPLAGAGGGVPDSPLDLVVSIQSNEKGEKGGCCPLNPVVSAHPNEEKTVPLWRGRGEDFAGCQKPHISEYVTVQPPPLTPPTRGGEVDIGKLAPTRGREADIGKFAQTGSRHIPSPLMGEGKGGGELFPKHFLEKLKLEYIITSIANSKIYDTLSEIGNAFNKAGIPFILLKGSHLAQFVYQDIGLRPMGDIDILVKKEDLQKAEELLHQTGYRYLKKTLHCQHLPPLSRPDGIKALEVHWSIMKPIWPFKIDIEGLWERAKTVTINTSKVMIFSPEDVLLCLSLHTIYQHDLRTFGIGPYCDVAAIINHGNRELDWNKLQTRAHEWGIEKYLHLILHLSHEILGINIPDKILHSAESELLTEQIVLKAKKRILSSEDDKSFALHLPHLRCDDFHPNNRLAKRIYFIFQLIFVSKEELTVRYSLPIKTKQVYFYYFIHFLSLMYRFVLPYIQYLFYRLIHKKEKVYKDNLDLWLVPPNSKHARKSEI